MDNNWFHCSILLTLLFVTMAHPMDRSHTGGLEGTRQASRRSTRMELSSEDKQNTDISATTIATPESLLSTRLTEDFSVPDQGTTNLPSDNGSPGLLARIMNSVRDRNEHLAGSVINSEDTVVTDIQSSMEANAVTSYPHQGILNSLEHNERDSTDIQQIINLNQRGNTGFERVLRPAQTGAGCTLQICENILQRNRQERRRSKPPPVPLKANNWRQIERQRQVIVQYNDLLSTTVSEGQLPPIPRNQAIVNLTGEEDEEVMGKFGSFFHSIDDVPPSDNNFRRGNTRHKRGTNVYVCAHERSWEDIFLAFSADNGLVQLYQTDELRQFVLTNRCTETRSSVVPGVVCVNDISTVNVIVVNFDSGLIQPAFINVETCRAKFVT